MKKMVLMSSKPAAPPEAPVPRFVTLCSVMAKPDAKAVLVKDIRLRPASSDAKETLSGEIILNSQRRFDEQPQPYRVD